MSSRNSITTSPGPGVSKRIGSRPGGIGSYDLWREPEAVILSDDQIRAMKRLRGLRLKFYEQKGWPRKKLSELLTDHNRRSSISILAILTHEMGYHPALKLTQRVFSHDPKWSTSASAEIFEDWARTLGGRSQVFCLLAYEWAIRQPSRWTPSLGQFLEVIDGYQTMFDLITEDLE